MILMFAVAVASLAGCSSSSSPDIADAGDATDTQLDPALLDAAKAVKLMTGEEIGVPPRLADDPIAGAAERAPAPAEIADGADSDAPAGYQTLSTDEAVNWSREASQPMIQDTGAEDATKRNGRSDGDDPEAALIVPKITEQQDDAPLNNGRESSAAPIPEGQRVAVAPKDVAAEPLEDGRTPTAEPGAEVKVADPVKVKPTIKRAAPSRETLSDLPKSIQALDKDGDGQLGLYEWPREKLAEFKMLDSSKDGFLTPTELVAGQKKAADAASQHREEKPAASSDENAKEEAATKTENGSQQDGTDEAETPGTSANESDSQNGASADDQPAQGS